MSGVVVGHTLTLHLYEFFVLQRSQISRFLVSTSSSPLLCSCCHVKVRVPFLQSPLFYVVDHGQPMCCTASLTSYEVDGIDSFGAESATEMHFLDPRASTGIDGIRFCKPEMLQIKDFVH